MKYLMLIKIVLSIFDSPGKNMSFPQHNISRPRHNIMSPEVNMMLLRINISGYGISSRSHDFICLGHKKTMWTEDGPSLAPIFMCGQP